MSIANLGGSDIIVDDIIAKSLDTPTSGDNLLIGTVTANSVVIGRPSHNTDIEGALRTNNIDVNLARGSTLFIGATNAVDIAIGKVGGNPITVNPGILTTGVDRGGSLGVGVLTIGNAVSTTSVVIGQAAAPTIIHASSLSFPTTDILAYSVSDSRVLINELVNFTGGVVAANACRVSYFRLGQFVTVQFHGVLAGLLAANSTSPIILPAVLLAGYRPANQITFIGFGIRNTTYANLQINILTNGDITMGAQDTNFWSFNQIAFVYDFCYTFNVDV